MDERIRYEGRIEDDRLVLAGENEQLEVAPVDTIVDLIGGETYTIEYEPKQSASAWVATDEDDTVTFDVRDVIADWAYTETFVSNIRDCPLDGTDDRGDPLRASVFAELVTSIWDAKGDLEGEH